MIAVAVRIPGRKCCLSLPSVIGCDGIETVIDVKPFLDQLESSKYNESVQKMEEIVAQL